MRRDVSNRMPWQREESLELLQISSSYSRTSCCSKRCARPFSDSRCLSARQSTCHPFLRGEAFNHYRMPLSVKHTSHYANASGSSPAERGTAKLWDDSWAKDLDAHIPWQGVHAMSMESQRSCPSGICSSRHKSVRAGVPLISSYHFDVQLPCQLDAFLLLYVICFEDIFSPLA